MDSRRLADCILRSIFTICIKQRVHFNCCSGLTANIVYVNTSIATNFQKLRISSMVASVHFYQRIEHTSPIILAFREFGMLSLFLFQLYLITHQIFFLLLVCCRLMHACLWPSMKRRGQQAHAPAGTSILQNPQWEGMKWHQIQRMIIMLLSINSYLFHNMQHQQKT